MLKNILLGYLNYRPMTGYELKQALDTSTSFFWHAHHSQIYTTLRQMEKDGLVTSTQKAEDDALRRRVYDITDEGRNDLRQWLETPMSEVSHVKEEFLVRIFFSGQRDPQKVLAELHEQHKLHTQALDNYQNLRECMPAHEHSSFKGTRDHIFWNLTLEMGFLYEKMYLEWLEMAIKSVEQT